MVLVRSRQEDGVPAAAAFPDAVDLDLVEDAGMSKLIFSVRVALALNLQLSGLTFPRSFSQALTESYEG